MKEKYLALEKGSRNYSPLDLDIHGVSKILLRITANMICYRFLRGTCRDANCSFSHKIVKEKVSYI